MNRISQTFLFSIFSCVAPLAAQAAEHDLRVTAKKGSSLWYTQESKQEQALDMGGQQMDMGNTTTYTMFATVKDVDEKGQLVVEAKIIRIKGTMTIPMMGDIEFDSADAAPAKAGEEPADEGGEMGAPDFDAIGRGMTSLAGATFVAKVDPFGKVQSMDGVDKVLSAARKKAGGMGAQMLGASLNDSAMERLVSCAFGSLPDKPVAVGGSWERNEDGKSSRMQVANKMKLTLAKIDANSFEVTATGTIEKPSAEAGAAKDGEGEQDAQTREMLAKMKIENGKITGSTRISRQDGFMIESSSVMSMDLTLPSPMGGDMQIAQKNTTVTKRTTEAEATPKKAEAPKEAAKDAPKEAAKEAGK